MAFELNVPGNATLFDALAALGSVRDGEKLLLPPALGDGYVLSHQLGPLLTLVVHQYELTRDVHLRRAAPPTSQPAVVFSFRNLLLRPSPTPRPASPLSTVRVSSADLDFELFVPAHTRINSLLVTADVALFNQLALPAALPGSDVLRPLLTAGQSFLYEGLLSPAMQAVAAQLVAASAPAELLTYYLKVKTEELLYLFLAELLKRQQVPAYPVSAADATRLYQVRDQVVADLSVPPQLPALARAAGLSESRLKRLFKQVFGTTVYDYYQAARLQEAARLLELRRLTVAEVAYQLGFTNLSHFARLFARYHGRKPKQYSQRASGSGQSA